MQAIDRARRLHILHAMGLQPQRLRSPEAKSALPACVLLVPASLGAPEQALLRNVLAAMALPGACLRTCEPGSRRGPKLGRAARWIVFGSDAERALRAQRAAAGDAQAQITVTHEPQQFLRDPLLKRELWQLLRMLRAQLAGAEV